MNQVLQAQVTEHLQAAPYERTGARQGYRNGYKPHHLTTRGGTLTLRVPQVQEGQCSSELFARYQRSAQALVLTLREMVVNGVSTRKVAHITEELCGKEFSKSTVSDLCKGLDAVVHAWNERDLSGHRYPFLVVDVLVLKVREGGQVRSLSALIAFGINETGYREILGLQIGDSESEASWTALFTWLKRRGLQGGDLLVSDDHGDLVKAMRVRFQGASWQRYQTHLSRKICDAAPKPLHDELHGRLRAIFAAPDLPTARTLLERFISDFAVRAPTAVQVLEQGFDDATAVLPLPAAYRQRLRTNNGVERLHEEIRRRERIIRIFPNRDSAIRLIGALLLELDEQWSTGHRYLEMQGDWPWRQTIPPLALSAEVADQEAHR